MQAYSFLTAGDILDAARAEAIGSTSSSLTALQDTQMLERIEQLNAQFVNFAHTRHPKGGWSWMERTTTFQTKAHTTLNGALSAGAASVILISASDFDSSGRIVIDTSRGALDFVDYSSKASNTLTVGTPEVVSIAHSDGEHVEKLYPLPSDYSKTKVLYVNGSLYLFERFYGFPMGGYFTTYGNYILMPRSIGAQDVTLFYEKKGATITETSSTTDIPTEFQRWAIEMLKAHIFMIRRQRSDIATAIQLAEQDLSYALDMDTSEISSGELTVLPLPY